MVASDLYVLLAAPVSPPDHRSASVKSTAIRFIIPLSCTFQEVFWVRVRPAKSLLTTGQLTNSENVV
jgi:hypothetical protein